MDHFRRIASGIDTSGIRAMLEAHPEIWDAWMGDNYFVHGVKSRVIGVRNEGVAGLREALILRWLIKGEAHDCAPEISGVAEWARDTVATMAALIRSNEIGRVMLAMLRAGDRIQQHTDGINRPCKRCQASGSSMCRYLGRYPERFHCVIASNPDCWFTCGEERVCMAPGELWWFNQRVLHSVKNSGDDRIHLILDARLSA